MNQANLVIAAFAAFFAVHLYIRAKVLKAYNVLSRQGIQFKPQKLLTASGLEQVISEYPDFHDELKKMAKHLRASVGLTSLVIVGTVVVVLIQYL